MFIQPNTYFQQPQKKQIGQIPEQGCQVQKKIRLRKKVGGYVGKN